MEINGLAIENTDKQDTERELQELAGERGFDSWKDMLKHDNQTRMTEIDYKESVLSR